MILEKSRILKIYWNSSFLARVSLITLVTTFAFFSYDRALADESTDIANLDITSMLDNIVLSASKHAETLEESAANIFIVTRDMIMEKDFDGLDTYREIGKLPRVKKQS